MPFKDRADLFIPQILPEKCDLVATAFGIQPGQILKSTQGLGSLDAEVSKHARPLMRRQLFPSRDIHT